MSNIKSRWINPKRKKPLYGYWSYVWSADKFVITLDKTDSITGMRKSFSTYNDEPEWGDWKLDRGWERKEIEKLKNQRKNKKGFENG